MKTFKSPQTYIAQVKEELKSYFATGAIDDLLFPIWIQDALGDFRKSQFPIYETLLDIRNYMAELPCDFESAKTVWACHNIVTNPIINQGSFYTQIDCRITPFDDKCHECFDPPPGCTTLNPDYAVTLKSTGVTWFTYSFSHLLQPATHHTLSKCGEDCDNKHIHSQDTFDIRDNKLSVNFRAGKVHLVYYSTNLTDEGEQLVPSDQFTKNYLIAYLKFKIFESLYNSTTDESVNTLRIKKDEAEQKMYETKIIAQTEMKKGTKYDMINSAKRLKHRFDNYKRSVR